MTTKTELRMAPGVLLGRVFHPGQVRRDYPARGPATVILYATILESANAL